MEISIRSYRYVLRIYNCFSRITFKYRFVFCDKRYHCSNKDGDKYTQSYSCPENKKYSTSFWNGNLLTLLTPTFFWPYFSHYSDPKLRLRNSKSTNASYDFHYPHHPKCLTIDFQLSGNVPLKQQFPTKC